MLLEHQTNLVKAQKQLLDARWNPPKKVKNKEDIPKEFLEDTLNGLQEVSDLLEESLKELKAEKTPRDRKISAPPVFQSPPTPPPRRTSGSPARPRRRRSGSRNSNDLNGSIQDMTFQVRSHLQMSKSCKLALGFTRFFVKEPLKGYNIFSISGDFNPFQSLSSKEPSKDQLPSIFHVHCQHQSRAQTATKRR